MESALRRLQDLPGTKLQEHVWHHFARWYVTSSLLPLSILLLSSYYPLFPSLPSSLLPPTLPPSLPGRHISCGYEDGGVRVWSLKECTTVTTISPNHGAPVTSMAAHSDGVLLMTGSEDSTARLVNSSSGKVCTGRVQKKGETIGVQCGGETYLRISPSPPPPLFLLRLWPPLQLACLQGVQTVHRLWRQWLSVPPSLWLSRPLCLERLACGTLRHKN